MEGIVINTIDYKEKSKIVYLYTPNGINSVKALDVMKKNLGFTVTLNHVDFEVSNSKFPTVLEYTLKKSYYNSFQDIKKMGVVFTLIDVVNRLEGDYPHKRIFHFFLNCLDILEKGKEPRFVLSLFLIKMLYIFGVKPVFEECVFCGNKDLVDFSINSGGTICKNCGSPNEMNLKTMEWVKRIYDTKDYDEDLFLDINYKELLEKIYNYYLIHVNFKLKDYTF